MSFTFVPDDAGRSQIVVTSEPDYIVPLRIAPASLEDCLKQGQWLVVSMSVWSVHDIRAGHRAIELVKKQGGLIKIGLRPFNYPQENATWVPGLRPEQVTDEIEIGVATGDHHREITIQGRVDASPVWVAISEGMVISVRCGQLVDVEIEELIFELLSRTAE